MQILSVFYFNESILIIVTRGKKYLADKKFLIIFVDF